MFEVRYVFFSTDRFHTYFVPPANNLKLHNLGDSGHLGPRGLVPHKLIMFIGRHVLAVANTMHT
jgi:hypothetical protein